MLHNVKTTINLKINKTVKQKRPSLLLLIIVQCSFKHLFFYSIETIQIKIYEAIQKYCVYT